MARKKTAKSLDEYRRELYKDVAEFIEYLGVATHTYYSALKGQVRPSTMRKIAEALGVKPQEIKEFEIKRASDEATDTTK